MHFFKVKWKPLTPDNVISTYWIFGFILSTRASRLNKAGAKTGWTGQSNSKRVGGQTVHFPSLYHLWAERLTHLEVLQKCPPASVGKQSMEGTFSHSGLEGRGGVRWGGVCVCVCVCVCRPLWQGPGGLLQAGGPFVVSHSEWPSLKDPFFIFIALRVYAIYPFLHWLGQKVHSVLSKTKRHISFSPRLYWTMYSLTKQTFWPSQYMKSLMSHRYIVRQSSTEIFHIIVDTLFWCYSKNSRSGSLLKVSCNFCF